MMKKIVSLTVTHNHDSTIDKLIQSFEEDNFDDAYFCDACSTDNSKDIIKRSRFRNNLIEKEVLEGFSKNNNEIILRFRLEAEYYLLMNPDAYFDIGFINKVVAFMDQNPEVGVLCPKLLYPNGEVQKSWKKFPNVFHAIFKRLGIRKIKHEDLVQAGEIDWALGACLVIRKELLKEGEKLLDERYRLYCEDVDICFEARYKGFKVVGIEDIYVYHELQEKSSTKIFSKYNLWNIMSMLKFILKWNLKYVFKKFI